MKAVTWMVAQRCPEGFQTEEFPITPQGLVRIVFEENSGLASVLPMAWTSPKTEEFPITPQGLKALGNWLPQQPRLQIVLEATGPYWRAFTSGFNSVAPEIPIAVVNPRLCGRSHPNPPGQVERSETLISE